MEKTELTPYEQALNIAEKKTRIAKEALLAVGKVTPGVEKLIDEALEAYKVIDQMLGYRVK